MFVLGLDVGYSNLKLAFGNSAMEPTLRLLAAGAAPVDRLPRQLEGTKDGRTGFRVLVDGVPYVAGVPASHLQGHVRNLNEDYPQSAAYMALVYAALLETQVSVIDLLVTGLPVSHHLNGEEVKAALIARLQRVHDIDADGTIVEVKRVVVVPQPVGAFMDQLNTSNDIPVNGDAAVLVVDPGYFSVDWVTIQHRSLRDMSSGTSMAAMSQILESAAREITNKEKSRIHPDRIEDALREGRTTITLGGRDFDVTPYLKTAGDAAAANVVNEIKRTLRADTGDVDLIILAGGAAKYYEAALRVAFPRSRLLRAQNAVMKNARGFFYNGRLLAKDSA